MTVTNPYYEAVAFARRVLARAEQVSEEFASVQTGFDNVKDAVDGVAQDLASATLDPATTMASQAEAEAGVNNGKWMSSLRVAQAIQAQPNTSLDNRIAALEAGFVAGSPVSAVAANVIFSNIDCEEALFQFDGVSHNNGTATSLRMYYSVDNGSNWSSSFAILTASIVAGLSASGTYVITGLRQGKGLLLGGALSTSGTYPGFIPGGTNPVTGFSAGAQINAFKFEWAAGSGDAGTITPSYKG